MRHFAVILLCAGTLMLGGSGCSTVNQKPAPDLAGYSLQLRFVEALPAEFDRPGWRQLADNGGSDADIDRLCQSAHVRVVHFPLLQFQRRGQSEVNTQHKRNYTIPADGMGRAAQRLTKDVGQLVRAKLNQTTRSMAAFDLFVENVDEPAWVAIKVRDDRPPVKEPVFMPMRLVTNVTAPIGRWCAMGNMQKGPNAVVLLLKVQKD